MPYNNLSKLLEKLGGGSADDNYLGWNISSEIVGVVREVTIIDQDMLVKANIPFDLRTEEGRRNNGQIFYGLKMYFYAQQPEVWTGQARLMYSSFGFAAGVNDHPIEHRLVPFKRTKRGAPATFTFKEVIEYLLAHSPIARVKQEEGKKINILKKQEAEEMRLHKFQVFGSEPDVARQLQYIQNQQEYHLEEMLQQLQYIADAANRLVREAGTDGKGIRYTSSFQNLAGRVAEGARWAALVEADHEYTATFLGDMLPVEKDPLERLEEAKNA